MKFVQYLLKMLKYKIQIVGGGKWFDASGFLPRGLSEGENMTNVRSHSAAG